MIIVFTAKGPELNSQMDPRFGRSEYLIAYNSDADDFISFDNRSISEVAHGAGPKTAEKIFEMKADVLVTGNGPGGNALSVLERAGIKIYTGAGEMTVKEALKAYSDKQLKEY